MKPLFDQSPGDRPMTANVDGGCSHNPGGAVAAGFVLRDASGAQVAARGYFVAEHGTSNMGELFAVRKAAEVALAHGATSLRVFSDSQLTVMVVVGRWQAKLPHIQRLRDEARAALNRLPRWEIRWTPREQNQAADTVCHDVLRLRRDVDYGTMPILEATDTDNRQEQTRRRTPRHKSRRRGPSARQRELSRLIAAQRRETLRDKQLERMNMSGGRSRRHSRHF